MRDQHAARLSLLSSTIRRRTARRGHRGCATFSVLYVLLGVSSPLEAQTNELVETLLIETVVHADPVESAYRFFERTGRARVILPKDDGGSILFPFGHARPEVHCPRLNACMILLEPGETLTDEPLAGDTERWIITTSITGRGEHSPLVVVKPQFCAITTNLLIPTDRRVYELSLVSDPCEAGDSDEAATYTRQVSFWYPDQMRDQRMAAREQAARVPTQEPDPDLNRDYDVDRGWFFNRKRYPWIPEEVFDDGVRTYIVLPEQARTAELPILYLREGGDRQVLNYALRGDTIVADRVLRRAILVADDGGGERKVEIKNRSPLPRGEEGTR